jgi:Leucine Rich repeat
MGGLLTNFNFLLSFSSESALANLDDAGKYKLLKRIIHSGPSENAWRAILELLASWPDNAVKKDGYDLLKRELESWSNDIRSINSSWTILYENHKLSSIAKIVRSVIISRREQYGNRELISIINTPEISEVKTLVVNRSEIYIEGFKAIAASPYLENLTTLALEGLTLSDEKFEILFGATNLTSLKFLRLKDVGLNASRTRILINSLLIGNIKRLELSFNNLDDEAALVLADSFKIKDLEVLDLQTNFIRDKGALALVKAISLENIKELNIAGNDLTENCRFLIQDIMKQKSDKLII